MEENRAKEIRERDKKLEKLTYTIKEFAEVMQISLPTAHNMTYIEGFPCIWVGRKKIIPIEPLKEWLKTYSGSAAK